MIIKRDIYYPPAGSSRRLHIYLPDDYHKSEERYPVMYFFDGHNLFFNEDATYGKSWGFKEFLEGWNRKMIIVGMECSHEGNSRLIEYFPYIAESKGLRKLLGPDAPERIMGMGEATMLWVLGDVKPKIDREYRTIPFRECTGIGGSSMGGLMALYGVARCNRWFSKAACVSSSIGFCFPEVMRDLEEDDISPDTRVFLSWGTREAWGIKDPSKEDRSSRTFHWNQAAADQLAARGAAAKLFCQVEGEHCERDWEKQVPVFMDWLWNS